MARFIVHRLMLLPLLLVIFSVMVFAIVQAPPGDFLTSYAATLASSGSSVNLEQLEALRRQYGLDQPDRRPVRPVDGRTCCMATSACRSNTSGPIST